MSRNSIEYFIVGLLVVGLLFSNTQTLHAANDVTPKREMRAAWISTVANIDLKPGMSEAEYRSWVKETVQELERKNFNAIVFQVKPTSDALYPSELAPWSRYITGGEQGTDPGYDPLQIMLDSAHEYGLELHAWINPYRVTMVSDTLEGLAKNNIAVKNPDWLVKYGSQYYLNPGIPSVQDYLVSTVEELVTNYDVDAVHMDDYFYPGIAFDDEETHEEYGKDYDDIGDWRRANVSELVKNINSGIKNLKPWVQFGISPSGIWRNDNADPNGSATNGMSHYDSLFADSLEWIRAGSIDYITPQIYWSRELSIANYSVLLEWWSKQVDTQANKHPVNLYIGMADYKIGTDAEQAWKNPQELPEQIVDNRINGIVKGQMHFTLRDILANPIGYGDIIEEEIYHTKALTPSTTWNGSTSPKEPTSVELVENKEGIELTIDNVDSDARKYVIYRFLDGTDIDYNNPENIIGTVYHQSDGVSFVDKGNTGEAYTYGVTSISKTGLESSEAAEIKWPIEIIDKSILESRVKTAETKEEEAYTVESWQVLSEALAIAKAVIKDDGVTQEEVNNAVELLQSAIDNLENDVVQVNKKALWDLIAKADKKLQSDYTASSWKIFSDALAKANQVIENENVKQEIVDQVLQELTEAMDQLVQRNGEEDSKKDKVVPPKNVSSEGETTEIENRADKTPEQGSELPNTATHTFNYLVGGVLVLLIGGITYSFYSRRSKMV